MNKSRKFFVGTGLALLLVAVVAIVGVIIATQSPTPSASAAAPVAAAATTSNTKMLAASTTVSSTDKTQLANNFIQNFAADLGVSQDKLNSAFISATDQTADQAVTSGQITQEQANQVKQVASQGLNGLVSKLGSMSDKMPNAQSNMMQQLGQAQQYLQPVIQAVADSLKLTPTQLEAQIFSGKSIADVAKAQNVDINTVETAILNAVHTQLNQAATNGKMTQTQADKLYQTAQIWIDQVVNINPSSFMQHK